MADPPTDATEPEAGAARPQGPATAPGGSGEAAGGESAARGWVFIAGAKAWFVATSTAINFLLPRAFGSADVYGLFVTAFRLLSILNNLLVASTLQTTSKLVSEDEARAPATLRRGLALQGGLGLVLGAALVAAAGPFATDVQRDPALAPLFRIGAAVVVAYALYATLVGALNGTRRFRAQAGLDATFSLLRMLGLLGAAFAGLGAVGAMGGFATATVAVLLLALAVVGIGRPGEAPPVRRWVAFAGPLWAYQAFLNAVLLGDVGVLKPTVAELALAGGADPMAAAATASRWVGYYGAAQNFALVPYQLMLSVTFVVFPTVSRAASLGDSAQMRRVIEGALRFALLLLLAFAAPIAGASDGVMGLVYEAEYLAGAGALGFLVFGMVALGLFVVCATIISGAGRPAIAAGIAMVAFAVVVIAHRGFVLAAGLGDGMLEAGALGSTLGMTLALVLAGAVVRRSHGALLPLGTALRAPVAGAVGYGVAAVVPHAGPVGALAALAAGFFAYLGALVALRELRPAEIAAVLRRRG